jgi:hypothetical protein
MPLQYEDFDEGATTSSSTANTKVSNDGLASGLSVNELYGSAKEKVSSGHDAASKGITTSLPGKVTIESAAQLAKENVNKLGDLFKNAINSVTRIASGVTGRVPNPLSYYTTYNYIFTLSVLNEAQINYPDQTYKRGILGPLILKSGSGNPTNRVPTAHKTISNPSGSFDFFLEDLQIAGVIGFDKDTGNTNSTNLNFKIIEPYSMGLFFEVLQTAAMKAGHANYLDMPLLLTIEFTGNVDTGLQNVKVDSTTKHFPIKLYKFGMKVTGRGAEYEVSAYPFNERAYAKTFTELKTDVSIAGKTVGEMLQTGEKSLQFVLNSRAAESVKRKDVNVADQILISFPKDLKSSDPVAPVGEDTAKGNSATVNPNNAASNDLYKRLGVTVTSINKTDTVVQEKGTLNMLGESTMGFNLYNKGETPFAKDNLAYDEKTGTYTRGSITINPTIGEFRFAQGSDIINAINQVLLMSEYGRTAMTQIGKDGSIKWWRIETQMFTIPTNANLGKTGVQPKLVVYRVVPYDVDSSFFLAPNAARPGTAEAKAQVVKEYNYIYTGKNTDIINFDIEFKAGFYTQLNADHGANTGDSKLKEKAAGADQQGTPVVNTATTGTAPKPNTLPTTSYKDGVKTSTSGKGGGGLEDYASISARQFHDAITSGVDMINTKMQILGDPYYIGDSGMGNYSAVATDNKHMNADGAVDWQSGEVHILVNFRTPTDINQSTGLYDFTNTAYVPQFSGLYKVLTIQSNFSRGKFTQTLSMIRLPKQDVKGNSTPQQLAVTPTKTDNEISPQANESTPKFDDGSKGYAVVDETGKESTLRRNEYGDLYDASGTADPYRDGGY